jgi:outer membrane lipase/esterase
LDSLFPGAAQAATVLSVMFNAQLDSILALVATLPGVEIAELDVFGTVEALIANPAAFGLTDVTDACITPNVRPFTCKKPDQFLFWDGIHPTKIVHAIFAQEAATVLGQ